MLCFICKHEEHKKAKIKECKQCEKRLENNTSEAKTGALECAGARYGFGRNKMRAIAEDAGAIIKIGKKRPCQFYNP